VIRTQGSRLVIEGPTRLAGVMTPPGDKSLSHRALLCAALADGESTIDHLAPGDDVAATADALSALGVTVHEGVILGKGPQGMTEPSDVIDCRNSGTSMRLLSGVAAGLPFTTVLTGDASLRSRPMLRVVQPLREMGAQIVARSDGDRAPLAVRGGGLRGIAHRSPVASAQVKSALMLAGLCASGPAQITLPATTRDHTERMLRALGVDVEVDGLTVVVRPGLPQCLGRYQVPGDISSSAFFLAGAALRPGSDVTVTEVGVNPTRSAVLETLSEMGALVEVLDEIEVLGEPKATVRVLGPDRLSAVEVGEGLVPRLEDEIPVLAVLMSAAHGRSVVKGAAELRVKESDRISATVKGLRALGAEVEETADGFSIQGPQVLRPGVVESQGDHRVAMAFAIAALGISGETAIEGAACIATSYPGFGHDLSALITP
jgi:3-phosphoshikimate 1-carboxyvinyltransferase